MNAFRSTRTTEFLEVPYQDRDNHRPIDVVNNYGQPVRVDKVMLTDYPDGGRAVSIDGNLIRKDGGVSRQGRGGRWTAPEPLPVELAMIVDKARPGWWEGDHTGKGGR